MNGNDLDYLEALGRALQEIVALQAIYGDDLCILSDVEDARQAIEERSHQPPNLRLDVQIRIAHGSACMLCGMPPGYPQVPAIVSVLSVDASTRQEREGWSAALTKRAKTLTGTEAVMELVHELTEIMSSATLEGNSESAENNAEAQQSREELEGPKQGIGRRWIWVHHITSPARKKSIVKEATDLRLGGFLKPGYPGVVVVEGEACDEFVVWIKGNKSRPGGFGRNWGHHVRGEAAIETRQLPCQFVQVEEDMSALASLCSQHGLQEEFLEYVLQHKS